MVQVTNLSRDTLNFTLGSKNGQPITDHVKAGETKEIAIDLNSPQVQARVRANLIKVVAPAAAPKKIAATLAGPVEVKG